MAVSFGTILNYGGNSQYPWTFTSPATIDTTGAKALLVFVANQATDKPNPIAKLNGSNGLPMTMLGVANLGAGKIWAFGIVAPPQQVDATLYVHQSSSNGDPTNYTVIPLLDCDEANPFGSIDFAFGNGGTIVNSIVTAGAGSTVVSAVTGVYGPPVDQWATTGDPAVVPVIVNAVQNQITMKIVKQNAGAAGSTVTSNNNVQYNSHGILSVEIKASSGPAKQTLTVAGIDNTPPGMGLHLAKDPNVNVLGPSGINAVTTAFGGHTITRQTVVYYDLHGVGNVASGTPATIVERVTGAPNYRTSRSAVGVQPGEKKYWEIHIDNVAAASLMAIGVGVQNISLDMQLGGYLSDAIGWDLSGSARDNNNGMNGRPTYGAGATLMVAVDAVNGWIFMGMNGQWYNGTQAGNVNFSSGDGRTNNNPRLGYALYPLVQTQTIGDKLSTNFGKQAFAYAPPAGFTALDAGAPVGPVTKILTAPSLVADVALFGSHYLNPQVLRSPSVLAAESVMGAPKVVYVISPSGLLNSSALGAPTARTLTKLLPSGLLAPASVLGSHTALVGANLYPTGIAPTGTALGLPGLILGVVAPSIVNESFLGSPRAGWLLTAPGIQNDTQLGSHLIAVLIPGAGVSPLGIVNVSEFGLHKLNQEGKAPGIGPDETLFGEHVVLTKYELQALGIYEPTEMGFHTVVPGVWLVNAPSIINEHYLGNPAVTIPVLEGDIFIKVGPSWVAIDTLFTKYDGTWLELDAIFEKRAGIWVQIM